MSGTTVSPEARYARLAAALRDDLAGEREAADPAAARARRGFGAAALKTGGKIFAMLVNERLVVKLPRPRVAAMIAAGEGQPFDTGGGRVMREWVVVDAAASDARWLALARAALAFVRGG